MQNLFTNCFKPYLSRFFVIMNFRYYGTVASATMTGRLSTTGRVSLESGKTVFLLALYADEHTTHLMLSGYRPLWTSALPETKLSRCLSTLVHFQIYLIHFKVLITSANLIKIEHSIGSIRKKILLHFNIILNCSHSVNLENHFWNMNKLESDFLS